MRTPLMGSKCLRLRVTSASPYSSAVAATSASGQSCPELSNDPTCSLGDGAVDVEPAERREKSNREIGRRVPGEQLGTRDHGVAETVPLRPELVRASEVVDEDVGVDEEVSHVASRRATGRVLRALHRR
jgi:hypothetical protein